MPNILIHGTINLSLLRELIESERAFTYSQGGDTLLDFTLDLSHSEDTDGLNGYLVTCEDDEDDDGYLIPQGSEFGNVSIVDVQQVLDESNLN